MADQWFYECEGIPIGPVDSTSLRQLVHQGVVKPDTHVMPSGSNKWYRASQVNGLFQATPAPPPHDAHADVLVQQGNADIVSRLRHFARDNSMESESPQERRLILERAGIVLALVMSLVALLWVLLYDPLGSGVSSYDFSTPKAAYTSHLKMMTNGDIRALMEYQLLVESPRVEERIRTLEVRREVEALGAKILFISYEKDGVKKYETEGFEKDAKSGFWYPKYVSSYEVEKDNKELAAQMQKWTSKGEL